MSYGMTYDEFWNGNLERLYYYRQKAKLERERQNQMLWWAGYYNCRAIISCLSKDEDKKYPSKPERITELTEEEKRAEEEEQANLLRQGFHAFFDEQKRAAEARMKQQRK